MLFAPSSFPDSPQLQTKKALILLDFQNDFASPTGSLYADNVKLFLPKLPDLVARFREKGEVVWAKTDYRGPRPALSPDTGAFAILLKQFVERLSTQTSSDYPTPGVDNEVDAQREPPDPPMEPDAEAFLAEILPTGVQRCCQPDSAGSDIVESLAASIDRRKDIVVRKSDYSAFADMSLLFQLRTRMVTELYICGSLSNISVYASVLDAVRHGFSVFIVEDCLGYRDESSHVCAMRQMADNMCAEGTDYQELMDELAGLLGDVIKEDTYTTKLQVDVSRSLHPERSNSRPRKTDQQVDPLDRSSQKSRETDRSIPISSVDDSGNSKRYDSSGLRSTRERSATLESSPPRKRSTDDIDADNDDNDDFDNYSDLQLPSLTSAYRKQSYEAYARTGSREKTKIRVRRPAGDSVGASRRSRPSPPQSARTVAPTCIEPASPSCDRRSFYDMDLKKPNVHVNKKLDKKKSQATLGPEDRIGDGTSSVIYNIFSDAYAKRAFEKLKSTVKWQKMYHRTGEVPRLVAVEGDVISSTANGTTTYPIYRHPSDESPQLLPFSHTVEVLRRECEQHVGHPLNHVLIQHYRSSEDNISEHSDKTLDIVRGSSIVNLSLGAQRTMTLRTKKADAPASSVTSTRKSVSAPRSAQRVPLPNASLFILSESTNAKYLHSIRADKRPTVEKSEAELAFNGERISLTFRNIGTFITEVSSPSQKNLIWGQGARAKSQETAHEILKPRSINVGPLLQNPLNNNSNTTDYPESLPAKPSATSDDLPPSDAATAETKPITESSEADIQAEALLAAFGTENHLGLDFDWNKTYGTGFDVVNFVTKET